MQIRDVSCRHVPSPTHHRRSQTPICCASALRVHLHTSLWSLWIDPLAVTPLTLRLKLGEGLHGSDKGGPSLRIVVAIYYSKISASPMIDCTFECSFEMMEARFMSFEISSTNNMFHMRSG